jgi:hypothetical protein
MLLCQAGKLYLSLGILTRLAIPEKRRMSGERERSEETLVDAEAELPVVELGRQAHVPQPLTMSESASG